MSNNNYFGEAPDNTPSGYFGEAPDTPTGSGYFGEAPDTSPKKPVAAMGKDAIFHDKASLAAEAAFASNKYLGRDTGQTQALQAKRLRDSFTRNPYLKTPEREAEAAKLEKDAAFRLSKYLMLRESYNYDVSEADPSFAEQLVGGLGPSMVDEWNLVPVGKGKTLLGSGVKGAAAGLPLGIITAWEQGKHDVAMGLMKKDPDLKQLMEAGIDTALIVSALNMLTHGKGPKLEDRKPTIDPDTQKKAAKFVEDLGPVNPEQGIDTKGVQGPYYNPKAEIPPDGERLKRHSDLTPANVKTINAMNENAAAAGRDQLAGTAELTNRPIESEINKPYWVDPELQDAIGAANRRANAIDNLPGAAEVKTPFTDIQSPYMSREQLVKAQDQVDKTGEPAHSYMEIPEEMGNVPYWPDATLQDAISQANRVAARRKSGPVDLERGNTFPDGPNEPLADGGGAARGMAESSRMADLRNNAKFANELSQAKNAVDALTIALRYVKDDGLKKVAQNLFKYVSKDTQFHVMNPEDVASTKLDSAFRELDNKAIGLHITNEQGDSGIALRGSGYMLDQKKADGMSVEAVLHEVKHSVTDAAFYVASDPTFASMPKYAPHVKYVRDVTQLMLDVINKITPEQFDKFKAAFENAAEFNTYGWTNPEFRELLREVRVADRNKTGLAKFFEAIKAFFGRGSTDAGKALDSFLNRLDEIQGVHKEDVGTVVAKLMQEGVTVASPMKEYFTEFKQYIPMTFNQKVEFLKNPLLIKAYDLTRQFYNKADERFNLYQAYLSTVKEFMENDKDGAVQMFKVLADIQDPELKQARQLAETTNSRDQFLIEKGMNPEHVEHAIKVLNVLKNIGKFDQDIAMQNLGHNWHLEPMYFPREHTGQYTVQILDADGNLKAMAGFDSSAEAHKYQAAYETALQEAGHTGYTVSLDQHKINSLGDIYAMMSLQNNLPDFLKTINDKLLKEIEVAKRKFEMERSPEKVAGYTGESITTKGEQDRLFSLLQRRMEQSFSLEVKSNIIKNIKEKYLEDAALMAEQPEHIKNLMHYFVAREIGLDVSLLAPLGKKVDEIVHTFGKQVDRFAGQLMGYKGGDVSYWSPDVIRQTAQSYTWLISLFKLALSPATLTANASTLAMTPFDGFRTAFKEGVHPLIPNLAFMKSLTHMADKDSIMFLKQAKLDGMVTPRMSDPLTLIPTHETNRIDRVVNAPRDWLETKTNETGLIFYYHYYNLTRPELNPLSSEFKNLVYKAVRSWTGDYTHAAQVMGISQLGAVGQLSSNFAKWKYNQLGRLMNDLQDASAGNLGPLFVSMAITLAMAGLAGAPFLVEYEALRRGLQKLGIADLKPLNAVLYEGKDWAKENYGAKGELAADVAIKGPIAVISREIGEEFGVTAPDLSNNLRYSAMLDASTLPIQFAEDVFKGASWSVKELMRVMGFGYGATDQEFKEATKALPTVVGNAVKQHMNEKLGGDVSQYPTQDKGDVRLTDQEKKLGYLGMRSMRVNEQKDRGYAKDWAERYEKKQIGKLTNQLIASVDRHPEQVKDIVKDIYDLKGQEGIYRAIAELIKRKEDRATDYRERKTIEAVNNDDPVALSKALNALKNFRSAK